jgi:hypothetical protein
MRIASVLLSALAFTHLASAGDWIEVRAKSCTTACAAKGGVCNPSPAKAITTYAQFIKIVYNADPATEVDIVPLTSFCNYPEPYGPGGIYETQKTYVTLTTNGANHDCDSAPASDYLRYCCCHAEGCPTFDDSIDPTQGPSTTSTSTAARTTIYTTTPATVDPCIADPCGAGCPPDCVCNPCSCNPCASECGSELLCGCFRDSCSDTRCPGYSECDCDPCCRDRCGCFPCGPGCPDFEAGLCPD